MATLKDVAKLAHVDISTVSRALNNTSYVHPETKKRIMKAVKELSYKPNVLARGLRQGKLNTIAVVVPALSFSIFDEVVSGTEMAARENGYSTIIVNTGGDETVEKESLERLRNGFVDGIIIAATGGNLRLIRDIRTDMPVIQVIRKQDDTISSVVVDYDDIGYRGTIHLIEKGCRSIALINGSMKIKPYAERYSGYKRAIKKHKLKEITTEHESRLRGIKYGYECACRLLEQKSRPDAIIAATDAQGIGALRACSDKGIMVPDKMRVISMTGHRIGDMLTPSLTSMELPGTEIGAHAAKMLIGEISAGNDAKRPLQHLQFKAELMERETSGS